MKRIVVLIIMTVIFSAVFLSCSISGDESYSLYHLRLQELVSDKWNEYKSENVGLEGGLALKIIAPRGDFFSYSGFDAGTNGDIHFRVASNTKTFTSASILLLDQMEELDIDDVITDTIPGGSESYIPDTDDYDIPYKDQITIRQLLGHMAGVFDVTNDPVPETSTAPYAGMEYDIYVRDVLGENEHTFTFDELVGVVALNDLYYTAPGEDYHYSNTGYSILGKIIERVSGKSYGSFVMDNFVTPNDLSSTSLPYLGNDDDIPSPFATGYLYEGGTSADVTVDNMSANVAEGNVISTPIDLARWVKLLMAGESGLDQVHANMMMDYEYHSSHGLYYGLGCLYIPGLGYGHNGGHEGYISVMMYDPTDGITLIIFSTGVNGDDFANEMLFLYELGLEAREVLGD